MAGAADASWSECREREHLWKSFTEHRQKLWQHAMKLTNGNADQANELVSLTVVKAAYTIRRRRTILREPGAYLNCTLRNEFIGQYRRQRFERKLIDSDVDIYDVDADWLGDQVLGPEAILCASESLENLERILKRLPERYKILCQMRFIEEKSYQEISSELNISEALARKRVQLLRERLKEMLEGAGTLQAVRERHPKRKVLREKSEV